MMKTHLLRLIENDLGQILDGLRMREESWRRTADYFRSGCNPDDSFAIEEGNDEHEANRLAEFYSRIIREIEQQRDMPQHWTRESYLEGKADGQDNLIRRVLENWEQLQRLDSPALVARFFELKDDICDD
jgi:hypothetical protein